MKQRALPQSFWQEPNVTNPQAPGAVCSTLPPLELNSDLVDSLTLIDDANLGVVPSLSASATSLQSDVIRKPPERMITAANTDLLFSLFNSVEEEEEQRRIHIVRRGRPKKLGNLSMSCNNLRPSRIEDDPCLNSVVAESILPLIPERSSGGGNQQTLSQNASVGSINSSQLGSANSIKGSQGTQVTWQLFL